MKKIAIFGSTGSIGTQTLDEVRRHPEEFRVVALSAHTNRWLFFEQIRAFRPQCACLSGTPLGDVPEDLRFCQFYRPEELTRMAAECGADDVMVSIVGVAGLEVTMAARRAGKRILLANKETLVAGGELVMKECPVENGVPTLLPVDSEHSAIFQSLGGVLRHPALRRVLLTASGGPFRGQTRAETYNKTPAEALRHPNWSMGAKITVDSATMMNKGLEFIEAMHLFGAAPEQITVLIHPQSVVHSAVEFTDGSVVAQLAVPDMLLPIQYALTYPERAPSLCAPLDLFSGADLHFEAPDLENTPCLALAMGAARRGGTAPAILSAANEAAVGLFLEEKIPFGKICECVAAALDSISITERPALEDILEADRAARTFVLKDF